MRSSAKTGYLSKVEILKSMPLSSPEIKSRSLAPVIKKLLKPSPCITERISSLNAESLSFAL